MATTIYGSDGRPIEYTKGSYNPVTQENEVQEEPPLRGNFVRQNQNYLDQELFVEEQNKFTIEGDSYDEEYDRFGTQSSMEEVDAQRVANQTNKQRLSRALVGGLLGGVGTALTDIGYMVSPNAYANFHNYHSVEDMNMVTRALVGLGSYIEQGVDKAMPIYENIDPNSISSQVFNYGTLKGIMNSSLGFMLPGMAVVKSGVLALKLIKGVGKLARYTSTLAKATQATKIANRVAHADNYLRYLEMADPKIMHAAKTGALTYINGVGEAMYESEEAHDNVLRELSHSIQAGDISSEEAMGAADSAAEFVNGVNIVKSILNYSMMGEFIRPVGGSTLKTAGKSWIERYAKEMPKEVIEETSQEVGKMEGEFRAYRELGESIGKDSEVLKELIASGAYDPNTPDKFMRRMGQFYTSTDAIVSGIIGGLSGPVQSTMGNVMRGNLLPGARYRSEKAAYKEQQKDYTSTSSRVKESEFNKEVDRAAKAAKVARGKANGVHNNKSAAQKRADDATAHNNKKANNREKQSEEANAEEKLVEEMERAGTAESMNKMTAEDPSLRKIAAKQVMHSIVAESHAKGTFKLLEKQIKENPNDPILKALGEYIKKSGSLLDKANRSINSSKVFIKLQEIESRKEYLDHVQSKLSEAKHKVSNKAAEGEEVSQEEKDNLDVLRKSIKESESGLEGAKEDLTIMTARKEQRKLYLESVERKSVERVTALLEQVKTKKKLEFLRKTYKGLDGTKEYKAAKDRILRGKTSATTEKIKEEEQNKNKTEAKQGEEVPKESEPLVGKDVKTITPEVVTEDVAEAIGEDIESEDVGKVSSSIFARMEADKTSTKTQEEYNAKYMKHAKAAIEEHLNNKLKESQENERDLKEELRLAEKRLAITGSEKGIIVEDIIVMLIDIQDQMDEIAIKLGTLEKKEGPLNEEEVAAYKELSQQLTILANSNLAEATKALFHAMKAEADHYAGNKDSATKGVTADVILSDFKLFIDYIESLTSEKLVAENFELFRGIFAGKNPGVRLATSLAALRNTTISKNPITVLVNEINTKIKSKLNNILNNRKVKRDKKTRLLWNRNGAMSIAHLSQTYEEGEDVNGLPSIENDDDAKYDMPEFMDPDKYNGGEEIEFSVDMEYKGHIKVLDSEGNVMTYEWESIKDIIFDEDGKLIDNALEELNKAFSDLNLTDIFDVFPMSIKGKEDGANLKFVHAPSWITERTTAAENIESHRKEVRRVRRTIGTAFLKGQTTQGTIKGKILKVSEDGYSYNGFAISHKGWKSTEEGVPEDNIMGVITSTGMSTDTDVPSEDILNHEQMLAHFNGATVVLVPLGKVGGVMKYHAEPVVSNTVGEGHQETIREIIKAFISKDKTSAVAKAYNKHKLDITTVAGAKKALTSMIYVMDETDSDGNPLDMEFVLSTMGGNTALISVTKEGISFGIDGVNTINVGTDTKKMTSIIEEKLDHLFLTGKFLYNTNVSMLKKSGKRGIPGRGKVSDVQVIGGVVVSVSPAEKSYKAQVKSRTRTRLEPIKLNDSDKTVHILQTIIEFNLTDGVTQKDFTSEGIPEVGVEDAFKETAPPKNAVVTGMPEEVTLDATPEVVSIVLDISSSEAVALQKAMKAGDTAETTRLFKESIYYKKQNPISSMSFLKEFVDSGKYTHELSIVEEGYMKLKGITLQDLFDASSNDFSSFVEMVKSMTSTESSNTHC